MRRGLMRPHALPFAFPFLHVIFASLRVPYDCFGSGSTTSGDSPQEKSELFLHES